MSGKSTYLRQVALCVVLAQAGSLVPAAFASLAPRDRLLARLGAGDSLETSSSSLMVEMQAGRVSSGGRLLLPPLSPQPLLPLLLLPRPPPTPRAPLQPLHAAPRRGLLPHFARTTHLPAWPTHTRRLRTCWRARRRAPWSWWTSWGAPPPPLMAWRWPGQSASA